MLKLYNSLSQSKEEFHSFEAGKVSLYVCGVTVYDYCHIGHARAYTVFDTIRRYLRYKGYVDTYIQNFTDVDDKIINRANECGEDPLILSQRFINAYHEDMKALNILPATIYPKVSEHLPEIINFIHELINKQKAYVVKGDVYFSINSIENYGKLSKRSLEDMQAGARVDINENKRHPMDFVLWKSAKLGEPNWKSPWGAGRPGWHIECSAMSRKYLGDSFDIHGGGRDLIFPHHENEIAQSEALTGKPMAKYWMHNGFVTIDKEKMSKSLGNFFTVREVYKQFDPMVLRLFFLGTHYRSPLNYSTQALEDTKHGFTKLCNSYSNAANGQPMNTGYQAESFRKSFEDAMDDDINTAKALAVLFDIQKELNKTTNADSLASKELYNLFIELSWVLGLEYHYKETQPFIFGIQDTIDQRQEARKTKNWALADQLRDQLIDQGIILEDTPQGVRWHRK